jgi:hypothetical protein
MYLLDCSLQHYAHLSVFDGVAMETQLAQVGQFSQLFELFAFVNLVTVQVKNLKADKADNSLHRNIFHVTIYQELVTRSNF